MSFAFLPFYTGDYLRDTRHLSMMEHGAYVMFLTYCWDQKGPVPLDERKQIGIVNARSKEEIEAMRGVLREFFTMMDDGWYNHRMVEEVARAEKLSAQNREAGLKSASIRQKLRSTRAQRSLNARSARVGTLTLTPTLTTIPTANPTPKPEEQRQKRSAGAPPSAPAWEAYRVAYLNRYGTEPVRNAKVNGQLSNLVSRLGAEEAPQVAAFYVSHNRPLYVSARHAVDLLLRDAEGLRTQWVTGSKATTAEARNAEQVDELTEQVRRVRGQIDGPS